MDEKNNPKKPKNFKSSKDDNFDEENEKFPNQNFNEN